MTKIIDMINQYVWGIPALILILFTGILLTVRTGFVQIRLFKTSFRVLFSSFKKPKAKSGVSGYQALCTALAATVGTGNIAGVAGAITIGGPGAIFWMWVCAFLGMATKYAEASLAVHYRISGNNNIYLGGPMYIVRNAMSRRWQLLAAIYCFFGVAATFGVGSATQVNALIGGINSSFNLFGKQMSGKTNILIGIFLSIFVVYMLFGGAKRISNAASLLVPFASLFYLLLCLGALICNAAAVPGAFAAIIKGAFRPAAVTGGMVGSALQTLRIGASRGVFTNEAGMGTAGIAHASADVCHPAEQGMMGIVEVFLDTIVICTMTGLVILCSGINIPYGYDFGIRVTTDAFVSVYGNWVNLPITFSICCFAVATILGWGLYGIRCAEYLFGNNVWNCFAVLQGASVVLGAVLSTGTVWTLSEIANGLMAIPNLIVLICFSKKIAQLTKEYVYSQNRKSITGGTYENFNQCQSLRAVSDAEVSSIGNESGKRW